MHVISRKALRVAAERHPAASPGLDHWYRVARKAQWGTIADVRRDFAHADPVMVASGHQVTVFNVGGNSYRLIAAIHYNRSKVYVAMVLTHAEYSKETWKDR
jgi:mRNA interferase HigB